MQPTLRADSINRKTGTQFEKPPDSSLVNPGSVEQLLTSELTIASLIHWLHNLQQPVKVPCQWLNSSLLHAVGSRAGWPGQTFCSYKALFNRVLPYVNDV